VPPHKSLEPGTLAVRLDMERRAELIEAAPEVYFVTDHYSNSTAVLVRLWKMDRESLRGLLRMTREYVMGTAKKKRARQ
jgi:hypothetical protein